MQKFKRKIIKSLLFIATVILLSSCDLTLEGYLTRDWTIREMTYKGQNLKPVLLMNLLIFENNGKCNIPLDQDGFSRINLKEADAKWSLTEEGKLKIESVKEYLNGEFDFCFGKDPVKKSVYIIISSQDLYLKAYRKYGEGYTSELPISCQESPDI